MNKQKFIDLLRKPHTATDDSVTELESVIEQFPYFQTAHIVLARGSKNVKHPKTSRRISSAAVYSTDRVLLKKYINDHIIFLDITKEEDKAREAAITAEDERLKKEVLKPQVPTPDKQHKPKQEKVDDKTESIPPSPKSKPTSKPTPDAGTVKKAKPTEPKQEKETPHPQGRNKIPPLNLQKSDFDADSIIDEMKIELEEYKKNKKQFDDWVQNEEERNAVEAALKKVSDLEEPEISKEEPIPEDSIPKEIEEDAPTPEDTKKEVPTPIVPSSDASTEEKETEVIDSKIIPTIEDVKPVEFKTASIPKPKTSGYSGKILVEGSNKNIKAEEPKEEPKRRERPSKRVVKKVKRPPETSKPEEAVTAEKAPPETEVTPKNEETPKEVKSPEQPKTEPSNLDVSTSEPTKPEISAEETEKQKAPKTEALKEKAQDETIASTDSPVEKDPIKELSEAEAPIEESKAEAPKPVEETKASEEVEVQNTDKVDSTESSPEIDDIPAPSDDDSTPDDEESFDLELNDEKGHINREDDKFDIKKDKKRAGQLRKEKMRKLREQRGIIDEFIETDPQMPSPDKKKIVEETDSANEEKEDTTQDLAEESKKPNEEMISENLAIIYKNQGKLTKAIEIYEKLILKFPKKEAYFAARIEELKKS